MNLEIFRGILIPFLGTMLGAACDSLRYYACGGKLCKTAFV